MPHKPRQLIDPHAVLLFLFAAVGVAALLCGCATSSQCAKTAAATPASSANSDSRDVIRYGRYTLVEISPEAGQRELLDQIVDVTVPANLSSSVGDALRYVLLRSGYRLCEDRSTHSPLDALPLPVAHTHLGPMRLRDALTVLVGPARDIHVDEATREICFSAHTANGASHS